MAWEHWEFREHRERSKRQWLFAAGWLGVERDGISWEEFEFRVSEQAWRHAPCRGCGRFGDRVNMSTCDGCVAAERLRDREQADYLRRLYVGREPLGKRMADGHGCVATTTIADRVTLGGESPYE